MAKRRARERMQGPGEIRSAATTVIEGRREVATALDLTFGGSRNVPETLGYAPSITADAYRLRYKRGGISKRIVDALPTSVWRGGGELVEDEDPNVETPFETAFNEFNDRLHIWSKFRKAHILALLSRFSVLVIGAPGAFDTPLTRCRLEDIKYIHMYGEPDIRVSKVEEDTKNERYGLPTLYTLSRKNPYETKLAATAVDIHWTRVRAMAPDTLDDPVFSTPLLEAVWNYLDDLLKVVGGGAEAVWMRADGGLHAKIDPGVNASQAEKEAMSESLEAYRHGLKRIIKTRGVDVERLGSDVADFSPQAAAIIELISATIGIPQRILMGSERGELASSSDESNYDDRVQDIRDEFAEPFVREFVDHLISLGALPQPEQYEVRWPEVDDMTEDQKMDLADKAASVNQKMGQVVIPPDEIRDRYLGLPTLEESGYDYEDPAFQEPDPVVTVPEAKVMTPKAARLARLGSRWKSR